MDNLIGIVAGDAGGANQIASYVRNNPGRYFYCLDGPAKDIFNSKVGRLSVVGIEEILQACSELITGTGWRTSFEVESIRLAKEKNIKVITHLDHWTNYRERFCYQKSLVLPDEIWVSDTHAEKIAISEFPEVKVVLIENFYISEIIASYKVLKHVESARPSNNSIKILFLSEPALTYQDSTGNNSKLDEFAAFRQLLSLIADYSVAETKVRVRLHPSEKKDKFEEFLACGFLDISKNQDIAPDLAWADFVVGLDTYAMYVASCLGIPTATIVSEHDYGLAIPKQGITDLRTTSFRSFLSEV